MTIIGRRSMKYVVSAAAFAVATVGAAAGSNPAAAAEPSWKGKTLNVIIRSSPGGGYDFYGRLISRHMPKYLPGKPDSIATNMSGAGGIVAANYMMNRAKKDGTEIGIMSRDFAIAQRTGEAGIKYDVTKLIPIGSPASSTWVWLIRGDHEVQSLSDLKKYKGTIKFSGTGKGSGSYQKIKFLEFAGLPVKVITGYDGTEEKVLAVARGEVEATSGSYESSADFIKAENMTILGRMGNHPETLHAERARDVLTGDARALTALMEAPLVAGRPFVAPPGVDPAKVKALRSAFREALKDPQLLKEAKKADRSINYTTGEEMEEIYRDIIGASEQVIAQFKAL